MLTFKSMNNEAKYAVLITVLRLAKKIGTTSLTVYFDSQLLINKVKGEYAAKGKKLKMYLKEAKELMERFSNFQIEVNPRESNSNILISNGNTS